uniref:EF-hand domain-containing protein n=1 Tax=Plectus sambesii TaxID=2011161 RepID=A0A914X685_9BILA
MPIIEDEVETSTPSFASDFLFDFDSMDYSKIVVESDANHDGKLSFDEFTAKSVDDIVAWKKEIFQKLDSNGNGVATQEEIDAYRKTLEYSETASYLLSYDRFYGNGDGNLQADEFLLYTQEECFFRSRYGDGESAEDGSYTNFNEYFSKWDKDGDQSWNAEEMDAWNKETLTDDYLLMICNSIELPTTDSDSGVWGIGSSSAAPDMSEEQVQEQDTN